MNDDTMTTYKLASGDLIMGEYAFFTSLDGWTEELDGPTEIVEEQWSLVNRRSFTLPTCSQCDKPAEYWGLCEAHAREDDPEHFGQEVVDP